MPALTETDRVEIDMAAAIIPFPKNGVDSEAARLERRIAEMRALIRNTEIQVDAGTALLPILRSRLAEMLDEERVGRS